MHNHFWRQKHGTRPVAFSLPCSWMFFFCLVCLLGSLLFSPTAVRAETIRIGILMVGDIRLGEVNGLKDALVEHAAEEQHTFVYDVKNARGDRKKLPELAAEIIAGKPDIAVAGGGLESDALLVATAGTGIPAVFLSCASSVQRGIVADMVSSGNNFTGIDTNDTNLTAKRIWFIKKMLPGAKTIFCFHVPSIVPSGESIAVARETARELGFTLQVAAVESDADITKAAAALSRQTTDVILQVPVAPIDRILKRIILPRAMAEKIPIFGYGKNSIQSGAFASYAGSRYANGRQAARLIHKIVNGIRPTDIPVEIPEKLELVINKSQVERLGLKLTNRTWRMADEIVDIQF